MAGVLTGLAVQTALISVSPPTAIPSARRCHDRHTFSNSGDTTVDDLQWSSKSSNQSSKPIWESLTDQYVIGMDSALHVPENRVYIAQAFGRLPAVTLEVYRRQLVCDGCGAPAYFTVKRSSGNSYFFGARPHKEGCELSTSQTGDAESANLFEVARREAEDGVLRIVPDRLQVNAGGRFEHDPEAVPHAGKARRYSKEHGNTRTVGSIGMSRLLRRLLRDPAYRDCDDRMMLDDGTEARVRHYCVELNKIDSTFLNARRLYWGAIIFGQEASGGGAWLFTAKGLPNVRLNEEVLDLTLARTKSESLKDLAGASFLVRTWYSPPKDKPEGRPFLNANNPARFTLRLASQDPVH